jgi:hypothetical protein
VRLAEHGQDPAKALPKSGRETGLRRFCLTCGGWRLTSGFQSDTLLVKGVLARGSRELRKCKCDNGVVNKTLFENRRNK